MAQQAKTRQGSDTSLKKQILEWWAALPEPTTRAVAELCGTSMDYVRVVVRQRGKNGTSAHDKKYREDFIAKTGMTPEKYRYHTNPASRVKTIARNARWYKDRAADDPVWKRERARVRKAWVTANFGTDHKYKKFLKARKAAKSSKIRV